MHFAQRILSTTVLGLLLCTLAIFGIQPVQAAATCSITTIPANATIDAGQSVDFTGAVSGRGKKTCDWTFDGGVPSGATSDCAVSVTYASAGSFTATLDGTAAKENPSTCTADVTVTVNGGGVNNPPTANNDSYDATTATQLSVSAPGVLGNDTDDGKLSPLVVSNLVSDVSNGSLSLNIDGSFSYTSDPTFEGDDSFSYEISDGEFVDTATVTITVADTTSRTVQRWH